MEEAEVVDLLISLLEGEDSDEGLLAAHPLRAVNFTETGLLTRDAGVLLKIEDGSEFQITVVQSRRA